MDDRYLTALAPDAERGRAGLKGYRRYRYTRRERSKREVQEAFVSGTGLTIVGGELKTTEIHALRFSTMFVAHVRVEHLYVIWDRSRSTAQQRFMCIFVSYGAIAVDGEAALLSSEDGGLCVILPGSQSVELSATPPSEAVFFTFSSREVAPIQIFPGLIEDIPTQSAVFHGAYSYLRAIALTSDKSRYHNGIGLHSLTRELARALVFELASAQAGEAVIERALALIGFRYADPELSPDLLSDLTGTPRRSMERAFSRRGMSIAGEIRRVRARMALDLLLHAPDLSISDIAVRVGFGSPSSMARACREIFGATPSDLRQGARRQLTAARLSS